MRAGRGGPTGAYRARAFAAFALVGLALVAALPLRGPDPGDIARTRALVAALGLTDLCLFTETRYTRHPAMADLHSAFQEHPVSFEHFPSGSLLGPPPHLAAGR